MCYCMIQQINGNEEDCRRKVCSYEIIMIKVHKEKPWLIHVPAAAVIHEWLALFVIVERKLYVD